MLPAAVPIPRRNRRRRREKSLDRTAPPTEVMRRSKLLGWSIATNAAEVQRHFFHKYLEPIAAVRRIGPQCSQDRSTRKIHAAPEPETIHWSPSSSPFSTVVALRKTTASTLQQSSSLARAGGDDHHQATPVADSIGRAYAGGRRKLEALEPAHLSRLLDLATEKMDDTRKIRVTAVAAGITASVRHRSVPPKAIHVVLGRTVLDEEESRMTIQDDWARRIDAVMFAHRAALLQQHPMVRTALV